MKVVNKNNKNNTILESLTLLGMLYIGWKAIELLILNLG